MLKRLGPAFQVAKTAIAAGLAWELATFISESHSPYFAPLAVILTLQATIADTMEKALYRLAGMVGGVIVSLIVHWWLPTNALAITLSLLLGMGLSMLLRLNPQITSQIGATSLLVLIARDTRHYAADRVLETALGAFVAVTVNALVIPPDLTPLARKRICDLTRQVSDCLFDLAGGGQEPAGPGMSPRAIRIANATVDANEALKSAQQSIRYNPFLRERAEHLAHLAHVLPELEKMAIQVRGILRGVSDLREAGSAEGARLPDALEATAACVAAFGEAVTAPGAANLSALEGAIVRAHEKQSASLGYLQEVAPLAALREQGAILTDLHRMLTEISRAMRLPTP